MLLDAASIRVRGRFHANAEAAVKPLRRFGIVG